MSQVQVSKRIGRRRQATPGTPSTTGAGDPLPAPRPAGCARLLESLDSPGARRRGFPAFPPVRQPGNRPARPPRRNSFSIGIATALALARAACGSGTGTLIVAERDGADAPGWTLARTPDFSLTGIPFQGDPLVFTTLITAAFLADGAAVVPPSGDGRHPRGSPNVRESLSSASRGGGIARPWPPGALVHLSLHVMSSSSGSGRPRPGACRL
jgi:hypothetical protein